MYRTIDAVCMTKRRGNADGRVQYDECSCAHADWGDVLRVQHEIARSLLVILLLLAVEASHRRRRA